MSKLVPSFIVLAALALGSTAHATLIAYDGFEGDATGALNSKTGGTGWSASWSAITGVTVAAPSTTLVYNSGAVSLNGGNRVAQVSATGTTDNVAPRSFASQTGTLYFSFLFRLASGTSDDDFIQFMLNDDTSVTNSASIGDLSNVSGANDFSSRIGGSNGGTSVSSNVPIAQATTYLLVGKVSKVSSSNYNHIDLFINPSTTTETGALASQTVSASISSVSYFTVRVSNIESTDQYQFDELRIGTTWADVVPVPEPSAWPALAGALGLAAAILRRRRA